MLKIGVFWMFGKIHLWSHLVQDFCLLGVFGYCFSFPSCNVLFRFSDLSWFSVARLCVSRNLSILSWLSNFLAYSCLYYFLTPFVFFGMEKRDISCTIGELADWCSHGRKHYGVYIKQSKIKLLHDPAIQFLGIYAW